MKTETERRIEIMRKGEKLQCPRCKVGHFLAVGNPMTTNVFKCDNCGTGMTLTVKMNRN